MRAFRALIVPGLILLRIVRGMPRVSAAIIGQLADRGVAQIIAKGMCDRGITADRNRKSHEHQN